MTDDSQRNERRLAEQRQRKRAVRAERVASWYFRLNGFLSIPGFVVHPDVPRRNPLTEADLVAVRFPESQEIIGHRPMVDDRRLTALAPKRQLLFLLVEVKSDLCNINGPWSDPEQGNMQRVISRLGFADSSKVDVIAQSMYAHLQWSDSRAVLQYLAVGKRKNDGRQRQYPKLLQITWNEIADFLFERFHEFPEKLPNYGEAVHEQWPDFGKAYGRNFRELKTVAQSQRFVMSYIDDGPAASS